jgi:pimeloyl-ACP methyl ester carboxylesterase
LLDLTWAGLAPADRASFCWRLPLFDFLCTAGLVDRSVGKLPFTAMAKASDTALTLYRVSDGPEKPADIVFVHGLMGSATQTWAPAPASAAALWPNWLSAHANIWLLDYPADLFWWSSTGASMALPERARSVIDLLANHQLGLRPLIFVTHSLGGLLAKAVLRAAQDFNQPSWKRLLANTRGVVFLGTPHTGASLGTLASVLRSLGITVNAIQIASSEPHLLDLTAWYSNNADRLGIQSLAYYEKGTVEDEGSSDPRVQNCLPVPSDANHIEICKPKTPNDPVYMGILRYVESILGKPGSRENNFEDEDHSNYNIDSVFGIHRGDIYHYVERKKVDDVFLNQLIGGKHLCIYGSSKQGKTALRKKHITASQALVVVCDRKWTSIDVWSAILKAAKCAVQNNQNDSSVGAVTVRVPSSNELLHIDLAHNADFLLALDKSCSGNYIIIEEFHYLTEETQRDLAFKLKAIHELSSKYVFIIIGVWLENNRLVYLNEDLAGRVAPVNADEWSDEDLLRVVRGGEEKLNIQFPPGFAEKLVDRACGSVYLVREACYRACEIAGIYKRADLPKLIERTLNVRAILRRIGESGVDYPGHVLNLLGLDIQLTEHDEEEELMTCPRIFGPAIN